MTTMQVTGKMCSPFAYSEGVLSRRERRNRESRLAGWGVQA